MDLIVATLLERAKWLHDMYRDEVRGLSQEQIDFTPAPGTNSIGVLVTHVLAAQREFWSLVANVPFERDRPAEFVTKGVGAEQLLAQIDGTERLLEELAARIDAQALAATWARPNGQTNTGAYWLINQISHAREHLGHLQLTKQLYPDHFPPLARAY